MNIFLSTPIYYASNNLHLGNAYTTVLVDILARHFKRAGNNVYYLTGSDEHGAKIAAAAAANGLAPLPFLDQIVADIQAMWHDLGIDYNQFIRTTDKRHQAVVQAAFNQLLDQGDIYLGNYSGYYCRPCEAFFTELQLDQGACPDCHRAVELTTEPAFFFKASKYAESVKALYQQQLIKVLPANIVTEIMNNFLDNDLNDLCVSRTSVKWGIPVPNHPDHTIYVWFDALFNYLSALGYQQDADANYRQFWNDSNRRIHFMGKEITRFHLIYWPMFLLALGQKLPTELFAHGWITLASGKMSKSRGSLVDPRFLVNNYGLDALRFYIAKLDPLSDNLYSPTLFINAYNTDLVNDLGNLTRRTLSMIEKYHQGVIPTPDFTTPLLTTYQGRRQAVIAETLAAFDALMPNQAVKAAWQLIVDANRLIETEKPWELVKTNVAQLDALLYLLVDTLKVVSHLLAPILTLDAPTIFTQLALSPSALNDLSCLSAFTELAGKKVTLGEVLHQRVKLEEELLKFNE